MWSMVGMLNSTDKNGRGGNGMNEWMEMRLF